MSEPSQRDEILAGILVGLETQSDFDIEAELARHPSLEPELRRSLSELGAAGMLPVSPDSAGFVRDVARLGIDEPPALRPVREATAARTADELVVPRVIGGRYRLHSVVGRGGMGAVYAAEDLELQREVALKLLLFRAETEPQARRRLARLLREARVTGQLDHPGIVPVYGLGLTSDRRLYYTMKLVRGRSLRELVRAYEKREPGIERALTIERRIEIVLRMCEALAFAHERGVVHRDLTPNNVMVGRFGEVLVMDWGIAKLLDQPDRPDDGTSDHDARASSPHRTTPGSFVGTPNFASPEQARGDLHTIDERTDVFGVGAILHYLLTGQPPYVGRDRDEVEERARQARRCEPEVSSTFARPPRELVAVSLKAMAADPQQRYATIDALAADLRAFVANERGTAWTDGPFATVVKSVRRHPTQTAVVVGSALCVLLGVLAYQANTRARSQSELRLAGDELRISEQARLRLLEHERTTQLRADQLTRLSDQYLIRAHDRMGLEAFANIERTLEFFRDCGFALDDASPTESVAMKIGSLRKYDPDLWKVLSDGIFDLVHRFELSKLGHAHRLKHGTLPARTSAARREEARRVLEGQPELTALFPRVRAILDALPLDPWDAEYR
ncbi:MAG: protein kinase domain-containing protein, partial [Planctomycetota bacterium]